MELSDLPVTGVTEVLVEKESLELIEKERTLLKEEVLVLKAKLAKREEERLSLLSELKELDSSLVKVYQENIELRIAKKENKELKNKNDMLSNMLSNSRAREAGNIASKEFYYKIDLKV